MNRKKIQQMVNNPEYIPGIYNYCDRWCERCEFTSRCLNFAMDEDERTEAIEDEVTNKAFWQKINKILETTLELFRELADQHGIDLENMEIEDSRRSYEKERRRAENHELSRIAHGYAKEVTRWFHLNESIFKSREKELKKKLNLGITQSLLDEEAGNIIDAVEVIHWYQHQIHIKMLRALMRSEFDEFAEEENLPKESDGAAKVGLIAIDRSIAAWGILLDYFPEKTDDVLDLLLTLDRLRKKVEAEFPDARAFVRPGFDTK